MNRLLAIALILMILTLPVSAERTFDDALSFDEFMATFLPVAGRTLAQRNPFFDDFIENNENQYFNPPITIYKHDGKISAITIRYEADFSNTKYLLAEAAWIVAYCITFIGTTEWDNEKTSQVLHYTEEVTSMNNPKEIGKHYVFYFDDLNQWYIIQYIGK